MITFCMCVALLSLYLSLSPLIPRPFPFQGGFIEDKLGQEQLRVTLERGIAAHARYGTFILDDTFAAGGTAGPGAGPAAARQSLLRCATIADAGGDGGGDGSGSGDGDGSCGGDGGKCGEGAALGPWAAWSGWANGCAAAAPLVSHLDGHDPRNSARFVHVQHADGD